MSNHSPKYSNVAGAKIISKTFHRAAFSLHNKMMRSHYCMWPKYHCFMFHVAGVFISGGNDLLLLLSVKVRAEKISQLLD